MRYAYDCGSEVQARSVATSAARSGAVARFPSRSIGILVSVEDPELHNIYICPE